MGGTGGRYSGARSDRVLEQINQEKQKERERLDSQVDGLIRELLSRYNDRDTEKVSQRLDTIRESLTEATDLDTILFGGSVAKHTAVDGLSDVDALVILDSQQVGADTPQNLIDSFHRLLSVNLPRRDIENISTGRLAVTVTYRDGQEIQLLPALRSRNTVKIAASDGREWQNTKPREFQSVLTRENRRMNQSLVPAIKLTKSVFADFPAQKQLRSYHIETLAVDAAKNYTGPKNPRALLLHTLEHASRRVLQPIGDVTGQSRTADEYLGPADSNQRRNISQTIEGTVRRLKAATTVGQWRAVLDRVRV